MKTSPRTLMSLVAVSVFAGCVVPDLTTKVVQQEFVCGARSENGETIVGRLIFRPYVSSATPVGKLDGDRWIEYSSSQGGGERRLAFLDEKFRRHDPSNNPLMLHEFLPLRGTGRWVAFRVTRITRSDVNLQMIVFDLDRVRSTHRIERVIRRLNLHERLAAYSIELDPFSGSLTVTTETGVLIYDSNNDRLVRLETDSGSSASRLP